MSFGKQDLLKVSNTCPSKMLVPLEIVALVMWPGPCSALLSLGKWGSVVSEQLVCVWHCSHQYPNKASTERKKQKSCFSEIVTIFCYQSVISAVVIGDSSWGNAGYYRRWMSLSVILSPTFLSLNQSMGSFKTTQYYCIDGTGSLLSSCVPDGKCSLSWQIVALLLAVQRLFI